MKKLFPYFVVIVFITIIFSSCNKDDSVSPGGGTTQTGPVTQTYTSNPNITIAPNTWTTDSLNANITSGINATSVSDIKLNLNTLENVTVSNLQFVLFHNGKEVLVINYLTNITGSGNITNLVLTDSAANSIMTVNGYPISGEYQPVNPLNGFDNLEASGYWSLKIYNSGTLRTGVIKSWGITITYNQVIQVPTFTSAYLPAVGDIHKFKLCDTNSVEPGTGGANVTWDFTNLFIEPMEYTDEYINPTGTPMHWHFPQSNIARKNIDLDGTRMSFMRTEPTPGNFYAYGDADSSINGLEIFKFIPYLYSFKNGPVNYNSMIIDSGFTYSSSSGNTTTGVFMDTVIADGTGTIKLPGGLTYNNVLRIVVGIAGMDTTNGTYVSYTLNRIYSWYTTGFKYPVLRIQVNYRYTQGIGGQGRKEIWFTTQNVPVSKY